MSIQMTAMISTALAQLLRFGITGLALNAGGYLAFLVLVALGMEVKLAMTLLYVIGVLLGFHFNRRWSFRDPGRGLRLLPRYVAVYLLGYFVNWAALAWFVDRLGWSHALVQAAMVFVVAALSFVLLKLCVFRGPAAGATADSPRRAALAGPGSHTKETS